MAEIVANARGKPGVSGPFCWQSVFILRHLREIAESSGRVSSTAAQSVYVALTELSTDARSASVQVSISEIAKRSGLAYRRTFTALKLIEDAGFLRVSDNYFGDGALRASCTYTLINHDTALCKFCIPHSKTSSAPILPRFLEEPEEEAEKSPSLSPFLLEDWVTRAKTEFPARSDLPAIAAKFATYYANKPGRMSFERFLEWIRTERNPVESRPQKPSPKEPKGWREFVAKTYPVEDHKTRDHWEAQAWESLSKFNQDWIISEMKTRCA